MKRDVIVPGAPVPENPATAALIERLARSVRPVRRIWPAWGRAGLWLGVVLLIGVGISTRADLPAVAARIGARPDMWLAVLGSVLTAVLAALAAMQLSLPDRPARWGWLPLPGLVLWLGASGAGCLRSDVIATLHPAALHEAMTDCMPFIVRMSVLLALPLAFLLWRAHPLRPLLVASMGGLASAAASASLLWLVHPFDASLADLLVHVVAVGAMVGLASLAGAMSSRLKWAPAR